MNKKKVCVIGAGSSGLIAVKELLDEGHAVTCYEKHNGLAGIFYHNRGADKAGAYDSVLLTISNYMMAYSCYPPKEKQRKFWTGREYEQYLLDFARDFSLLPCIQFETEVVKVEETNDNRYAITTRSDRDSSPATAVFDAVAICSGSNRVPKIIPIKGQETFEGEIHHSAYYRNAEAYKGKRVLCVGLGETGADVVHEIAQVASHCSLSLRHLQPVVERFPLGKQHPNDAYTSYSLYSLPVQAQNIYSNTLFKAVRKFSKSKVAKAYADWNIRAGDYFNHFFTKNEVFFNSIVEGKLGINSSGIDYIDRNAVVFKDGSREEVDVIMLNTGYTDEFSFLESPQISDMRQLYKHSVHPELGAGMVFIGWARPAVGGVPACGEMQSRYFALLCSGKKVLPSKEELLKAIRRQADFEDKVYFRNPDVRTLVHYPRYMSDFSKVIGCSPWRWQTFLNPALVYRLWFGSQMPFIYRLYGPHRQPEMAKKAIAQVPVAVNPLEALILSLYTVVARALAALRVIAPDPKY